MRGLILEILTNKSGGIEVRMDCNIMSETEAVNRETHTDSHGGELDQGRTGKKKKRTGYSVISTLNCSKKINVIFKLFGGFIYFDFILRASKWAQELQGLHNRFNVNQAFLSVHEPKD